MSSKKTEEPRPMTVEVTIGDLSGFGREEYFYSYTTRDYTSNEDHLPKGTVITCSLKYWTGKMIPQKGQMARLRNIQLFAKGWRAFEAEPISLETSNQKEGVVG